MAGYNRQRRQVRVGVIAVGALERSDPIPPGVYWIDSIDPEAFGDDADVVRAAREAYILVMQGPIYDGAFEILPNSHRHEADAFNQYGRDWILFRVNRPVPRWPLAAKWGFPTIAPRGENTQEGDTAQNEATPGVFDDWIPDTPAGKALLIGGAVGLAALLVIAIKS